MAEKREEFIQLLIDNFDFAKEFTSKQLYKLLDHATFQEVPAGTMVAEKGSYCPGLALLLFGELRVAMTADDGREVTIYRIGKGKICPLSAACILGGYKGNTVTVTTETDCKVIWVKRSYFLHSIGESEPFYRFLMGDISMRLFEATEVMDRIAFIPVRKRLANLLYIKSHGGRTPVYATHENLARELGTAREVISRELKGFERTGLLKLSRGKLEITDSEELEKLAL